MSEPAEFILRSTRVVLPGFVTPAAVLIRDGVVIAILPHDARLRGTPVIDTGRDVVMPGLVDIHVHINEPGRANWEGFESASRAAAAGGITTVVDMPLNSIPVTTNVAALHSKVEMARSKCHVDIGFWGGVIPDNEVDLEPLLRAGVLGFKCFLVPSGVDEFPWVDEPQLKRSLAILQSLDATLLVHAELPGPIEAAARVARAHGPMSRYADYLRSRPREAENEAVALMIRLAAETGARVHIVHVSSSDALAPIAQARARDGVHITAETCPHYLHFASEEIADGNTLLKCAPPIRERENREALWAGLGDGTLQSIASDHSPSLPSLKALESGDFAVAWGGISSLQLTLSVVWRGARDRGYSLTHVADWLCRAPARIAGLGARKGEIAPSRDADFVVWSPENEWEVNGADLFHRHPLTPYHGLRLPGVVRSTWLRGVKIYEHGTFSSVATGRVLVPRLVAR